MRATGQAERDKVQSCKLLLPQTDDDFGSTVKVAQIPAKDGRTNQTREDGFAFFVTRRRYDQMRHPRADLHTDQREIFCQTRIIEGNQCTTRPNDLLITRRQSSDAAAPAVHKWAGVRVITVDMIWHFSKVLTTAIEN